jgi:hypothetical protein
MIGACSQICTALSGHLSCPKRPASRQTTTRAKSTYNNHVSPIPTIRATRRMGAPSTTGCWGVPMFGPERTQMSKSTRGNAKTASSGRGAGTAMITAAGVASVPKRTAENQGWRCNSGSSSKAILFVGTRLIWAPVLRDPRPDSIRAKPELGRRPAGRRTSPSTAGSRPHLPSSRPERRQTTA